MTREEKIRAIKDIKNGIPAHIALNKDKYKILVQNESDNHFWTSDKKKISVEDQQKYLPDSLLMINVSKQFRYNSSGELIEIKKQGIKK